MCRTCRLLPCLTYAQGTMLSHTFCSPSETRFSCEYKLDMNSPKPEKEKLSLAKNKDSYKCRQSHFHNDLNCPVCLQTATMPVETNCGHLFCGSCLMTYWRHDPWLGAMSCPLCRQKVVILYNDFWENQPDQLSRDIVQDIRHYNNRFSGKPRPFTDYLYDMPSLLHLALRRIFTMGGLVWVFCLRILVCLFGAIVCLSSPFDAIPDPMCGILSIIDDLVVVFLLLICVINIFQQLGQEGRSIGHSTAENNVSEY
ncbi:E3 ubiquitin-protein ligase RNF170 isoform X1 [Xenopus laevis]|uniref:E3 ubiquitin-protein ligase RNF170 isoform X1 n=3 Tax=Xenopus laevis TaxID=8355 RepID=A0A8J0V108_XENLA|nr:E3 ubiquitin-protein ligase RNF170 isoform X1 [Xenopus laevis]